MRETLNYMIEANMALIGFLVMYQLLFAKEKQFDVQRLFLLIAISFSIILPFIDLRFESETTFPAIAQFIPEYWLPMVDIGNAPSIDTSASQAIPVWTILTWGYIIGVVISALWLVMQLGYLFISLKKQSAYKINGVRIIESNDDQPSFAFFKTIFIGRANTLTPAEKEQIIRHERVHAQQLHSIDILLITIVRVVFWFNPFLILYKKTLIQLHEFEADARAVENHDVNKYCSLLARVALQEHVPIASHFNESFTLKRIEMMRTIKTNIKRWKIGVALLIVTAGSAVIACQDQITEEMAKSTITQQNDYPPEVQKAMAEYQQEHPDEKLTYIEGDQVEIDMMNSKLDMSSRIIKSFDIKREGVERKGLLLKSVLEEVELATRDNVYVVVEQMPEFPGGAEALKNFIRRELRFPEEAKKQNKQGTAFLSLVISESGKVSNVSVLKGIDPQMDKEAVRVLQSLPDWIPGKQNGKNVPVRYTVPIRFNLDDVAPQEIIEVPNAVMKLPDLKRSRIGDKTQLTGQVTSGQKGLSGAIIVIAGTNSGTTTDANGNFTLSTPLSHGQLVISFVGFESKSVSF